MQEDHQHNHRQRATHKDVLLHQIDRGINVFSFVVDLGQLQALAEEHTRIKFAVDCLQTGHGIEHIGPCFA